MLTYLFTVTYKDGTEFRQTSDDVSNVDPKRSAFFDVRQDEVQTFSLSNGEHTYSVCLTDGHFSVDGRRFFMHDTNETLEDLRLIFYRKHTHSFHQASGTELAHDIKYCLGWQTTKDGVNVKRIMQII